MRKIKKTFILKIFEKEALMKDVNVEEIKSIILSNCPLIDSSIGEIDDLEQMGINSFEFVGIIVDIEEKYGIEIPVEKLSIKELSSIKKIVELVDNEKIHD